MVLARDGVVDFVLTREDFGVEDAISLDVDGTLIIVYESEIKEIIKA